jgi:purine-binding chemotaxis protein CheW
MSDASRTAAQLRQAFDQSFAEAVHTRTEPQEDFLAIRLGGDAHAIRLADVAHLLPLTSLTRFPSPVAELLGIIGFRGAIVPAYDLGALLGYAAQDRPRWLVIAAARPIALAFDTLEGHLRLTRGAGAQQRDAEPSRRHVQEVLRANEQVRSVVAMVSILATIRTAVQQHAV